MYIINVKKVLAMTDKTKLLQEIISAGLRVFTTNDACSIGIRIGLNKNYINIALNGLVKDGWLKSIKKGVYILAPTTGVSPIHEFEIAMFIAKPVMMS